MKCNCDVKGCDQELHYQFFKTDRGVQRVRFDIGGISYVVLNRRNAKALKQALDDGFQFTKAK